MPQDYWHEQIRLLMNYGATCSERHWQTAAGRTSTKTLAILINNGADIVSFGALALLSAAKAGNLAAITLLLESEIALEDCLPEAVAITPDLGFARILLDIWLQRDRSERRLLCVLENLLRTPIRDSVQCPLEKCELLKKYGLDLTLHLPKIDISVSVTQYRSEQEIDELLRFLIPKGAVITPEALAFMVLDMVEPKLLRMALNACPLLDPPDESRNYDVTPLQAAAAIGDLELVKELVKLGAKINSPVNEKVRSTALQEACGVSDHRKGLEIAQYLIAKGEEPGRYIENSFHGTALHAATLCGNIQAVALLLEHGVDVHVIHRRPLSGIYRSPLDNAAEWGRLDIAQLLLHHGATSASLGVTGFDQAITLAERNGYGEIAKLIQAHAKRLKASRVGSTPV